MAAPEPSRPEPINLDAVLVAGAVVSGSRVLRIVCECDDGRRFEIAFPIGNDAEKGSDLTDRRRQISQVIDEMEVGEIASTQKIADRSGWPNSGDFRDYIAELQNQGRLQRTPSGMKKIR